jgi:hypothetical protein
LPARLPGTQRTLKRKVFEIRVAREIERKFTKQEILELYLNHIYFGGGAYGIEAAARSYFGHSARQLSLGEAALLAALPKLPHMYDPRRNPERSTVRCNLVLDMMVAQDRIDGNAAASARRARLNVRRDPPPDTRKASFARTSWKRFGARWRIGSARTCIRHRYGSIRRLTGLRSRPPRPRRPRIHSSSMPVRRTRQLWQSLQRMRATVRSNRMRTRIIRSPPSASSPLIDWRLTAPAAYVRGLFFCSCTRSLDLFLLMCANVQPYLW